MDLIRFSNLQDLVRLKWFELDQGELVVDHKDVGSVIDMHTHIALSYLVPGAVDASDGDADKAEYYLPACEAIDLDVYANRNMSDIVQKRMVKDLVIGGVTGRGMRRTHTVPNLQRDMKLLSIAHSAVLPIELEFTSHNVRANLDALNGASDLIAFGSLHPRRGKMVERLEEQLHRGIRGIKLHPNIQSVKPNAKSTMRVYAECGARNVPVLIHCGPVGIDGESRLARYLSQVRHFEVPLRTYPNTTFILGHAGALQAEQALALQKKYANAVLELSCLGLPAIRMVLRDGDPDRIVFGSDWPFYHQAIPLAKVLIATEDSPGLRRKVLFDNAVQLFGLDQ